MKKKMRPRRRKAFSLVLSLTVMAMLLLLAIGAASLLAVELRIAGATVARAKARLNATAASRIALGEIQRMLGPDRRVTANAAILGNPEDSESGVARARYVGVWKSAAVDRDYKNAHDSKFVGWLSSGAPKQAAGDAFSPGRLEDARRPVATGSGKEWLLFDGGTTAFGGDLNLNTDNAVLRVYAPTELLSAQGGARFAWVAFDENQKASLSLREESDDDLMRRTGLTPAGVAAMRSGDHPRFFPGASADGLDRWPNRHAVDTAKVPGFASLELERGTDGAVWFPESNKNPRPLRYDFTTASQTLLTDTLNGGLKRDLSTLAAMTDADWLGDPLASSLLGQDATRPEWAALGTAADLLAKLVDPLDKVWPGYGDIRDYGRLADATAGVVKKNGAAPYVEIIPFPEYKAFLSRTTGGNSRQASMAPNWRLPVLARFRIEYLLTAEIKPPAAGGAPAAEATYDVRPKINVVAQLWNPYNVRLKLSNTQEYLWFQPNAYPVRLDFFRNEKSYGPETYMGRWTFSTGTLSVGLPLFDANDMEPGEVRTFSLPSETVSQAILRDVKMVPGYSPSGGVVLNLPKTVKEGERLYYAMAANDSRDLSGVTTSMGGVAMGRGLALNSNGASDGNNWIGLFGSEDNTMPRLPTVASDAGAVPKRPYNTVGDINEVVISDAAPSAAALAISPKKVMVSEFRLKSEAFAVSQGAFSEIVGIQQPQVTGPNTDEATVNVLPVEFVAWDVARRNNPGDPNDLQVIPASGRTFGLIGTAYDTVSGSTHYVRNRLPLTPPTNLFSLRHARLGGGARSFSTAAGGNVVTDAYQTRPTSIPYAFGNSTPAPFVPPTMLISGMNLPKVPGYFQNLPAVDYSWALNAILADTWFASSLGNWKNSAVADTMGFTDDYGTQVRRVFGGESGMPNARLIPAVESAYAVDVLGDSEVAKDAFRNAAALWVCDGGFNINSTSVRAWRAFLASGAKTARVALNGTGSDISLSPAKTTGVATVSAASVANGDAVAATENAASAFTDPSGMDSKGWNRVLGGRELSEAQLDKLALAMVKEVKLRGPFLSLGEFLNRRLEAGELGRKGAVQAAIDKALLNEHLAVTGRPLDDARLGLPNNEFGKAISHTGGALPGHISQADLLAPLSSALTPRGDTFTIRVAADSGDAASTPVVCELTVARRYEYLDERDAVNTETNALTRAPNKAFGRRFEILSVRWLDGNESL